MDTDVLTELQQLTQARDMMDLRYDELIALAQSEGVTPADLATAVGVSYSAATKALRKSRKGTGNPTPAAPGVKFAWAQIHFRDDRAMAKFGADGHDYEVLPNGALRVRCTNGAETVWAPGVWDRIEIPVDAEYRS